MRIDRSQLIYNFIHIIFWCTYVVTWSYTAVYLEHYEYSNTVVGMVTGMGAIISVLLQPLLASFVKKSRRLTTRKIIIYLKLAAIVFSIGMCLEPVGKWTVALLFMILATIDVTIPAMLSTLAMEYVNSGNTMNYGVARGVGSVAYAAFSFILGYILKQVDIKWLALLYAVLSLFVIIFCVFLKDPLEHRENVSQLTSGKGRHDQMGIMKKYPFLIYFLLGTVMLFMGHNMINMFLVRVIEKAGGASENLGMALAIAAILELPVMALFNKLVKRIKISKLLIFSATCFLAKCLLTFLSGNLATIYLAQVLQIGAFGLFTPASVYFINTAMDREDSSIGQALLGAFSLGLGGALGNVFGGIVIEHNGVQGMLLWTIILAGMGLFFIAKCVTRYCFHKVDFVS